MAFTFVIPIIVSLIWLASLIEGKLVNETQMSKFFMEPHFIPVTTKGNSTGVPVVMKCQYLGSKDVLRLVELDICPGTKRCKYLATGYNYNETQPLDLVANSDYVKEGEVRRGDTYVVVEKTWSCADEGWYQCRVKYEENGTENGTANEVATRHYLLVSGPVTITTSPRDQSLWTMKDRVTLTCTAPVGQANQTQWVWEFRAQNSVRWQKAVAPSSEISVRIVPGVEAARVKKGPCGLSSGGLQLYNVAEHRGRTFRCYVIQNGQSFRQFAANFTIKDDGVNKVTIISKGGEVNNTKTNKSKTNILGLVRFKVDFKTPWAIAVICVGAVLIPSFVAAAAFVLLRNRTGMGTTDDEPDDSGGERRRSSDATPGDENPPSHEGHEEGPSH